MKTYSHPEWYLQASFDDIALQSLHLTGSGLVSCLSSDHTSSVYLVMILADDYTVAETERVSARDDEGAILDAVLLADGRAIDVWNGLRFVEHVGSTGA